VIGRQGNGIEAFAGCHNPIAIAPYGDGVVTVEKGSQRVKVVDRRGGLVEVIAGPASFSAIDDFTDVADLAADDSRVLVLDVRRRCVRVFCRSIAKPDQTTSPPPIFQE
jgi:predicted methyltransferase